MDGGLFEIFTRGLFGIFKRQPVIAYTITITIIIVVLSIWIINAKNPDDRAYPVIALVFVLLVSMGRIVALIRQYFLQGILAQEEEQSDEESPAIPPIAQEIVPLQKPPAIPAQVPPPRVKKREKKEFFYYGLTGRDALQILSISALFLLLGYLAANSFGTSQLLSLARHYAASWPAAIADIRKDVIGATVIHLFCGLPTALCAYAPLFAILLLSLGSLLKNRPKFVKGFMVFPSFLFGILIYFPIVILFFIAADFFFSLPDLH